MRPASTRQAQVAVSQDHAIVLQPQQQSDTSSQKRKEKTRKQGNEYMYITTFKNYFHKNSK